MRTLRIGTAGWSIPRQHAAALATEGSHLERYARALCCAEINSTFYHPSRPTTFARWAASVPETFRFSLKAPKAITHEASLDPTPATFALLAAFLEQARLFGPALGPVLFQLPPKQPFDPARAAAFFDHLRTVHAGPVALEPRHPTWLTPEAEALLLAHTIARVAADPAPVPAAAIPGGSPALVYYRLHGSPRTYYSEYGQPYLEALAGTLAASSAAEAWVIFDNTASGAALGNALTLANLLLRPNAAADKPDASANA
jgi:uncharacterized protein YecE (DUF72 family)